MSRFVFVHGVRGVQYFFSLLSPQLRCAPLSFIFVCPPLYFISYCHSRPAIELYLVKGQRSKPAQPGAACTRQYERL
ncbi:hypothetical protein M441DRAFT_211752 [Trichoderma asperellum CBS 433.97]|uniref:Uncharacterized protein n=1 Tax=Trichoderma asperellum (strain ATCC 204424 / CBS 433.97 / NBRC 101777) TaxID=1042311 RepID=A0A2T3ZN93_TRIA4|nr:hypothetical protein M441DRAFT_211752 [Trichoderma asperellum CBS 433.97]PTB46254.1 hypothetical protein M441DRAFT_211752 [Trichoderma asperellum CBS 433.97]